MLAQGKQVDHIPYRVIVHNVKEGKHGPYAVTSCRKVDGYITVSLKPPVWNEGRHPRPGDHLIVEDVNWHAGSDGGGGWSAAKGRFVRPKDVSSKKK